MASVKKFSKRIIIIIINIIISRSSRWKLLIIVLYS